MLRSAEHCYQLSADGVAWSRTPERLCVTEAHTGGETTGSFALKTGFLPARTIGSFQFSLLRRVRCIDCNQDVWGVANPENSLFNKLQIEFDGKRDVPGGNETGTLTIGETKFHYRFIKR